MVVFQAAVSKFVKNVGEESLLPVPDLNTANNCRPFHIVVKKNRRWFWQSCKYEAKQFSIMELLTNQDPLKVEETTRDLVTYNDTHTFSVSGKVGGKLKVLLDAEIDGSDTIDIDAKLGLVKKVELNRPQLLTQLSTRSLNLEHPFVKQVRENSRKVLCVVVGVAKTSDSASLHAHKSIKAEEKVDVLKLASAEEDTSISNGDDKVFEIAKDTPLAYAVCELRISTKTGAIMPILEDDIQGGFDDGDETDNSLPEPSLPQLYQGIFSLSKSERDKYTADVLQLCSAPDVLEDVFLLIRKAWNTLNYKHGYHTPFSKTLRELQNEAKGCYDSAHTLLSMCGFKMPLEGPIQPPSSNSNMMDAMFYQFEALMELDDDESMTLAKCDLGCGPDLLRLLQDAKEGNRTAAKDVPNLKSPAAIAFLQALGIQANQNGEYVSCDNNPSEIQGAYRGTFGLWGE